MTDELVLRGNFQTLPIAIYGWALSTHTTPHVRDSSFPPTSQALPIALSIFMQAYDVLHHAVIQLR